MTSRSSFSKSLVVFFSFLSLTKADINWPEYSQQCQDDAGSPFVDDEPGTYYHTGSAAYPVLNNGQCANPLQEACQSRPDYKTAYLEGPVSCGGNGWYCRMFTDDQNGWPNINLQSDVNFGQCNKDESFDDAGYDQDGHCHGSSDDSTYYWWVRDHFFRQYNGKVRCCCGWFQGGTQPLYSGRIANRCDYRRLVTKTENVDECRDANEDHNMGFDDIGCDPQYRESQLNQPIPEDDNVCWEIERFGFTEGGGDVPTANPATVPFPTPPFSFTPTLAPAPIPTGAPTDESGENDDEIPLPTDAPTDEVGEDDDESPPPVDGCVDSELRFEAGGRLRNCNWVAKNTSRRCTKAGGKIATHCPKTCNMCSEYACTDAKKRFVYNNDKIKSCQFIANRNTSERCQKSGVSLTCRKTCSPNSMCSGDEENDNNEDQEEDQDENEEEDDEEEEDQDENEDENEEDEEEEEDQDENEDENEEDEEEEEDQDENEDENEEDEEEDQDENEDGNEEDEKEEEAKNIFGCG